MKECCSNFAKTFLLCFGGFILGRLLIFPGFVDLAAPSHSDLYRYFLISQTKLELGALFSTPRPLMSLFLHVVGSFVKTPNNLWVILSLSSIFFIAALVEFLKQFFIEKIHALNILVYATILFSLPSSWEIYQLDYGGMLSGVLCIVGLAVFMVRLRRQSGANASLFVLPLLMYWLAIEMKPTFTILALVVSLLFFVFKRDTVSIVASLGVFLISVFVFLKDKYLINSPFVAADENSIYAVKFNFTENFSALATYLDASVPLFLLPGVLLLYGVCLFNKNTRLLGLLTPVLALSAIAPMALIPNRIMTLYSWYPSVFIYLPLLILPVRHKSVLSGVILAAIIAAQCLHSAKINYLVSYFYSISFYNDNLYKSLNLLANNAAAMNSRRVLVSGLQGPYHAFWNRDFVSKQSGLVNYTVLLRNSERAWNEWNPRDEVYLDNGDIESFDSFIVYSSDGRIKYTLSKEELMRVPAHWREAVIFCAAKIDYQDVSSPGFDEVFSCFDSSGEYMAAVRLGKSAGVSDLLSPVALYYLGNALIKTGEHALARVYLNRALSSRPDDENIRSALKSIEDLK